MSIEIKELIVKFNVTEKQDLANKKNDMTFSEVNYKKLIKDCTEQVLKELEFKLER